MQKQTKIDTYFLSLIIKHESNKKNVSKLVLKRWHDIRKCFHDLYNYELFDNSTVKLYKYTLINNESKFFT